MNGLIRVELTRYRSRQIIVLLLAVAALLAAYVAFQSAYDTRGLSSTEIGTAQARAEQDANRSDVKKDIANCEKDPTQYLGPGTTVQQCKDSLTSASNSFLPRAPLSLIGTVKGNGSGIALLVIGLLIIAGSTFAGADWASGAIRNQVIFEPRRSRLWAAKAIAVAVSSGAAAFVVLGGFWLTLYLVAVDRGVPHGSDIVGDVAWHLLRVVLLAMGAGLGAYALTMIFRNSAATLAVLFTYAIGGEILVYLLPLDGIARWSLGNNIFGWLETRLEFFDPTTLCVKVGNCSGPEHISHLHAGLYLLVLLVVACVGSWATFRRRDL
jgi:ABC-2 type transport system permease protein